MNRIFKISFQIYRIILILIIPIYFLSKFLVGVAGHNPPTSNSEYLFLCFSFLALIALMTIRKSKNISLKKSLVVFISIFVVVGIVLTFCGLYDAWILYRNQNFGFGDNIPVAIMICFIFISVTFLVGLIKDKV